MIILASSSPRRIELLKTLYDDFKIIKPTFDESLISKDDKDLALKESYEKGKSILNPTYFNDLIISADTIVRLNNKVYGKPKDKNEAISFLKELSNNTHEVVTGYSLFFKGKVISKQVVTYVTFNCLNEEQIINYINNEMVLDKAGAYAIQDDNKFHIIKEIKGSYNNVIGFPIEYIKEDIDKLINS